MANKILVTGYSGTGKTYALRTLDPKKTFIICPDEFADFEFVGAKVDEQAMLNTRRFQISQNLCFMFRREMPGRL